MQEEASAKAFGCVYWRGRKVWIKYYDSGIAKFESVDKALGKTGSTENDARALLLERANSIDDPELRERLELLREQAAAEQLAADRRAQVEHEPNHEPHAPEQFMFADLERGIIQDYELREYRSIDDLKKVRLKHIRKFFHSYRAIDITTPRLRQYAIERRREGAANESINRELSSIRRMFRLAIQDRTLSPAQMPYFPMVEKGQPREVFISAAEFELILAHLDADFSGIVRWIWNTGWRVSAACKLEWRDVNREERWVLLRRENSKNKQAQRVPLFGELSEIIEEAHAKRRLDQPRVFYHVDGVQRGPCCQGNPFRREPVWRNFKRACVEAGIGITVTERDGKQFVTSNRTLHDMRRSAARDLIRSGITEDVARKITGHRTREVFSRYNISADADLIQALAALQEHRAERSREPVSTISFLRTPESSNHDAEMIQKTVSDFFHVRLFDLKSKTRTLHLATCRQVAMYLCRKLTASSFPEIGEAFGRHHSTVIHAHNLIQRRVTCNSAFRLSIEKLERDLEFALDGSRAANGAESSTISVLPTVVEGK